MDPAALLHAHPPSDLATALLPEDWPPSPSCCWALAPWAGDGLTPAPALCCHSLELLNTFLFSAEWHGDLSSLTSDRTCSPCRGSMES